MQIKIKKLHPDVQLPSYAHPGDAGLDLFSLEKYTLQPGERKLFPLGFSLEFEPGYVALLQGKSGLAKKHGIQSLAGVCDAGYRGEYSIILINLGNEPYTFEPGHKLGQLLIVPVMQVALEETTELSDTSRSEGGFGSTGK